MYDSDWAGLLQCAHVGLLQGIDCTCVQFSRNNVQEGGIDNFKDLWQK